jgi:hypothetical protein
MSRDLVVTAEQMGAILSGTEALLRDAGFSDAMIEGMLAPRPFSTFHLTTFHPRCNEPVRPESLEATDGSL